MTNQTATYDTTLADVRRHVADVTRYPLEILTPDADFEDDLGVDSVKQAEILAVIARDLGVDVASVPGRKLRNLGAVAELVRELKGRASAANDAPIAASVAATTPVTATATPVATASPVATAAASPVASASAPTAAARISRPVVPSAPVANPVATAGSHGASAAVAGLVGAASPVVTASHVGAAPVAASARVDAAIRAIFARITRYPETLLTDDADLEDDLGIDSVKQAEILATITAAFPTAAGINPRAEGLRSIGAITAAVQARMPAAPAVAAVAAVAAITASAASAAPVARPAARDLPFAGQIALVTGSGRGLGKVLAQHLARLGATVVVNSFHSREAGEATAAEIVADGGEAIHVWGSVANEAHLDAMFATIDARFGGLDLLVCAASDGLIGPFDSIRPADWDRAFRANITGGYECAMRASKLMRRRGGGAIVTMSTVTSSRYLQGFGCQGVVKAAVESLTRYLSFELAPYGIRANCVSAGPVYGELLTKFPEHEARIAHWESISAGGELCAPEDVAEVTAFLLSAAASRVTGAVWAVDNGVSGQIDGRLPRPALPNLRFDRDLRVA